MAEKPKNWIKRHPIWTGVIIFFVFIIFLGIIANSNNPGSSINVNPNQNTPLTLEQQMKNGAANILGERLVNFKYISTLDMYNISDGGIAAVDIYFNISDNLNKDYIREGALMDSVNLFKYFYTNYPEKVTVVQVMGYYPLSDQYGNQESMTVLKISLQKETADKINWNNFDRDNLQYVADSYYINQALQ